MSWRSSGHRVLVKSAVIPKDESSVGSVDSCGRFWVVTFTGIHIVVPHKLLTFNSYMLTV